jgi:imidazolonepropionase-like amidohydrolase
VVVLSLLAAACGSDRAQSAAPARATLAIVGATVVHPGGSVERDRTIVIAGDRIVSIIPASVKPPATAAVHDARGKWVIPGLIDSHVHFFQSANPFTRPDVVDFTGVVPYADEVARNKARLPTTFAVWLASGVVGVADVGGPRWTFEVRRAAAAATAPYVKVSGPLVSLVASDELALDDPPILEVASPGEARALVTRLLAHDPDYVKFWFIHRPGGDLASEEAIVAAAGEVAHAAGKRLLVHATELEVAKAALRAGADVLVHSVRDAPIDDEFITLAKQRDLLYIPTLWVTAGYAAVLGGTFEPTAAERRFADPEILESIERLPAAVRPSPESSRVAMKNLRRAWDAGIRIAMGTDAGNIGTLHGPSVFREMELMAHAGLSPSEVLVAATVNGARMLGMEDELGDVAAGKHADLVILDADPLADVRNLARIHRVVRDGRLLDPDELVAPARRR